MNDMVELREMTKETWHEYYEKYVPDPMMDLNPYTYNEKRAAHNFEIKSVDVTRKYFDVFCEDILVGQAYFKHIDYDTKTAEAAIALVDDSAKGKGVGTMAIELLVSYGFEKLGLEKIIATAVSRNTRSQHILQKLGFEFTHEDDIFKHYRLKRGDFD